MDRKKISKKRERSIANDIGGRSSPGSGSLWFQKSDAYSKDFRIEDKFTEKLKYSIQYSILLKIEKEAVNTNKVPVLNFGFIKTKENYAIIRKIDCNKTYNVPIFKTDKKSILFNQNELSKLYLSEKNIILCEINFIKNNKFYYLMTWKTFIENKEVFIA